MEILLALLFGAVYGTLLHFLQEGRESRGAALAPVLGAVAGGATWLALTWAGLTTENALLWIASVIVPAAVVPLVLALLNRRRSRHDADERLRLRIA